MKVEIKREVKPSIIFIMCPNSQWTSGLMFTYQKTNTN